MGYRQNHSSERRTRHGFCQGHSIFEICQGNHISLNILTYIYHLHNFPRGQIGVLYLLIFYYSWQEYSSSIWSCFSSVPYCFGHVGFWTFSRLSLFLLFMVRWEMREAHGLICAGWGACKQNRQEISPLDNFLSLFLSPFLWNGSDEFGGKRIKEK